jgi:predicted ATPase
LPKLLLEFANTLSLSKREVSELAIPFLSVKYLHRNSQDFIEVSGVETLFRLYETASGIQSVTPLLVLLEHLSRNTEQAQSFIIEEPELNLYPTAQQGLLNWLVEKCTKGENDLTITTHSPYILSHLNLLLYAYQVAHAHPDRAEEVAQLVPRESWINPQEFACYQVEDGGVTSLVSEELGLIDDNGLDNLSGDAADAFDNLIRLSKAAARK